MQLKSSMAYEVLQSLEAAENVTTKLFILRTIKNDSTGHELRKVGYIKAGLISKLDQLLSDLWNRHEDEAMLEDQAALDAIWSNSASIVHSIACCGCAFVSPILHSNLTNLLLKKLQHTLDGRLELIILRCLDTIAASLPLNHDQEWAPSDKLAKALYQRPVVARLATIVSRDTKNSQDKRSVQEVLKLICKTCTTEKQKAILVEHRILDLLCEQVMQFIAQCKTPYNTESQLCYVIQGSADHGAGCIGLILETITIIIARSKDYAKAFTSHEGLSAAITEISASQDNIQRLGESYDQTININISLPVVPDQHSVNVARRSPFPPLSTIPAPLKRKSSSMRTPQEHSAIVTEDEEDQSEYLIVPWLLSFVRNNQGRRRVVAARLLGVLKSHGLVHPVRTRSFGALLIPILVDMMTTYNNIQALDQANDSCYELIPSALALVVRDNEYLQRTAVEAKAIPCLAAALKRSFGRVEDLDKVLSLWWPQKLEEMLTEGDPAHSLGKGGITRAFRRNEQWRQGILEALGSLAPENEHHRKEIVDQGILTQIMQSLEPFRSETKIDHEAHLVLIHGNSPQTIIAACGTIRALTRSATSLRTKLVDADVAKPIVSLLHTSEIEVRIAATMVLANLAHDFSPMKQSVESVVRKLCEQAHSAHACLRLESLFALKALVNNSKNDLKRNIVEELGPNWIKHVIATDPHDVPAGEVIGLIPRDYRKGSMIRVSGDAKMSDADDTSSFADSDESERSNEYASHTLQQDLDIQAELLGFLRNLTTGERPDEIIAYLFEHVGQDDFLQILMERLKAGISQRPLASFCPPAILYNSLYILAHLCAADKRYRNLICHNVSLMKQVSSLLGNTHPYVRQAGCWLVTNLVYPNSSENHEMTQQRAKDLQKLGILNQIRRMEKTDPVVDVKERAATASECFSKFLNQ